LGGARGERFSGEVPIDKFIYGGWEVMIGGAYAHYGVLDVGEDLWERVVMVSDPSVNVGSPEYDGKWGDGVLDWNTGRTCCGVGR
jgi:hypothetical protein